MNNKIKYWESTAKKILIHNTLKSQLNLKTLRKILV